MKRYTIEQKEGWTRICNDGGAELGVARCAVMEQEGYLFKDPEGTGVLQPWCDWRLSPEERAGDLAKRLSVEEIAGLMIPAPHIQFFSCSGKIVQLLMTSSKFLLQN